MSISTATYLGEVKISENAAVFPQSIEIYRCEDGMLVGVDSRWSGQVKARNGPQPEDISVAIHSPYDFDTFYVLDPEHIAKSAGRASP